MAALECVARNIVSDERPTLGKILSDNPDLFPKPLGEAIGKIWGFTSQYGRHVNEGHTPSYEEAELVVGLASALSLYLAHTDMVIVEVNTGVTILHFN